jgi:hypothetical protein
MIASPGSDVINSGYYPDMLCDQLFFAAGLTRRWLPESPIEGSQSYLNQLRPLDPIDGSIHEKEIYRNRLQRAAHGIAVVARSAFEHASGGYFRAHRAIERNVGKCVAYHEVVSGHTSMLDLGTQSFGVWLGQNDERHLPCHASSGFIYKNTAVEIDGYHGTTSLSFSHPDHEPVIYTAAALALTEQVAVEIDCKNEKPVRITGTTAFDELYTLNLACSDSSDIQKGIVVPSSIAILMYAAHAMTHNPTQRFDNSVHLFAPYAALL